MTLDYFFVAGHWEYRGFICSKAEHVSDENLESDEDVVGDESEANYLSSTTVMAITSRETQTSRLHYPFCLSSA